MTQINISIKPSAEAIQRAYGNAGIKEFLGREIEKVAFKIQRMAKQVTPVDTGALRSSIATDIGLGELSARVATNKEYALYVHEGTKFMRGRPFMEQGVQFAQLNLDGEISAKLDQHLVKKLTKL